VGRLYGAEERVLERVVTYLVSAAEHGIRFTTWCNAQRHKYNLGGIEMLLWAMHTSVVLPAPCTPLRPTKNGVGFSPFEAKDSRCLVILSRIKGTQCSDLSSMISGILFSGELE
jgi:hypothetical protein